MEDRMEKRTSYPAVDLMKYAGSIMVIMIHCEPLIPQSEINFFIKNIICRIVVPFFFVSSAFFLRKGMQTRPEYLKKYLMRLLKSYILWSILFLPMGIDWIYQKSARTNRVISGGFVCWIRPYRYLLSFVVHPSIYPFCRFYRQFVETFFISNRVWPLTNSVFIWEFGNLLWCFTIRLAQRIF